MAAISKTSPSSPPHQGDSGRAHYAGYFLAFALLILSLLGFFLWQSYRQTEMAVGTISLNESHILSTQIDATLRRIDAGSLFVAEDLFANATPVQRSAKDTATISSQLSALIGRFPELAYINILDAEGVIRFSSKTENIGLNVSDKREHLRQLRQNPDRTLRFTETLTARTGGMQGIAAYRAILDREGRFVGSVGALINLDYFAKEFSTLQVGAQGMVSVRRSDDSRLVVRWPIVAEEINQPAAKTPPYLRIQAGETSGIIRYIGKTDGIDRIFAFHKVGDYPFYTLVGRSVEEQFGAWRITAFTSATLTLLGLVLLGWYITRLRRSEAVQRASEERYHAIIENQRDAICRWQVDTTLTFANTQYHMLFAARGEDLIGRQWIDFIPADQRDTVRERYAKLAREGGSLEYEHSVTIANGEVRWFHWVDVPLKDADGQYSEFQSVGRDITEQKYAEQALRSSEQRFRDIAMTMGDWIWEVDAAGRYTYASDNIEWALGYKPAELLGRTPFEFMDPAESERVIRYFQDVVARKEVFRDLENVCLAKDGTRRSVLTSGVPILSPTGELLGYRGTDRDITERIAAQQRLEAEQRRINSELEERVRQRTLDLQEANDKLTETLFAMNSVGIGISWADVETGRFIYANKYAAEFLGYTVEEYLQLGVMDIDPNFPKSALEAFKERIRQEQRIQFETLQKTKDDRLLPVEMTIYYQPGMGNRKAKFIAFMVDIQQRKKIEKDLQLARTAADAASQAKSEFLANMSHEIRTPLNAILGLNHLMRKDNLPVVQLERLQKMEISGRHLLSIINDILDLSKIEAGRFELETGNFHLSAVLDNVASIVRDAAEEKGLTLEIDPDSVPLWLRGDATRLRQALLNFASNAVKFTQRGGIMLRALLLEAHADDLKVRFEVVDSGIGLTPDQQARLFQSFHQADGSTARKYGGTGLGLALTKRLVELMDGEVGMTSHPDDGSTFWFTVPLQRGHGPIPHPTSTPNKLSVEERLQQDYRGAHILLAEDNEINIEVIREILHAVHLDVEIAADGIEAVEKVRSGAFDLVLMDMQMPRMNGLDATRAIRALPGRENLPILALTANAFAEDRRACLESGMNEMLAKPVAPTDLYTALVHWLPQQTTIAAAGVPGPAPLATPAEASPTTGLQEQLRTIPGLDIERGLIVVNHKPLRLLMLLHQFVATHHNDARQIESSTDSGDASTARHVAHSLKGSANTLGFAGIGNSALQIEVMLREAEPLPRHAETIRTQCATISTALQMLAAALPTLPAVTPPAKPAAAVSPTAQKACLVQLDALLQRHDIEAVSFLEENLALLRSVLGPAADILASQVKLYAFDAALATLREPH